MGLSIKTFTMTPLLGISMPLLLGAAVAVANVPAGAAERYEDPPRSRASAILPPDLVTGTHYRVQEQVLSDGFMNQYRIDSRFGQLTAESTAELRIRAHEINAMAVMEQVQKSKEFAASAKEGGGDVVRGAKELVTDPLGSASGAVSGVGALFRRGADNVLGDPPSDTEDSRLKGMIGFSKTKREYASEFGVDVYSSNPLLQERLDDLAWSGYAGGITMSALLAAVPGGAGVAVSMSGGSNLMNDVLRTKPPSDLRRMNREKLSAMGVDDKIVDLFLQNTVFSPTHQTLLVSALEDMRDVGDREELVNLALLTGDEDLALFRQLQAQMYAGFNNKVNRIERFVAVGQVAAARLADGTLVFVVPLDRLAWTRTAAAFVLGISESAEAVRNAAAKQLWVGGTLSPLAREKMEARGWTVHERAENRLLAMR